MSRRLQKRSRPAKRKRQRAELQVHRDRLRACRTFRIRPDPKLPFVVQLRLASSPRRMREQVRFDDGDEDGLRTGNDYAGLVRSWFGPRTRRAAVVRPRQIVARMYLNARNLRDKPSEIVAHECTHAALAWARFRMANLSVMDGEEVACFAAGHLVRQVNIACYASGVWPR
jgi:hypothetical protein